MTHRETRSADLKSTAIVTCGRDDLPHILHVINAAAFAYRGVIPADCWHEPYMASKDLRTEIEQGVGFTGLANAGDLVGVMGMQQSRNVGLIRHAYVLPKYQGLGVGSRLIRHLVDRESSPILVGTWAAASWAIRFYQRHGFHLVPQESTVPLLQSYWSVPARQAATSVVLAVPALSACAATRLIAGGAAT